MATAIGHDRPRAAALAPAGVALVLAYLYLRHPPLVGDLAAQTARADLFRRSGDVVWWADWYGGLVTTSYSVVTPVLLGLLGPVVLGSISLVLTPLAAAPLLKQARRPLLGGAVLALTAGIDVASGRTTFAAGTVVAILSLSAALSGRAWWAGALGLAAVLTSPVAGLLAAVIALAVAIDWPSRRAWLASAAGALVGLAALYVLSAGAPSGVEPFDLTDLWLTLGGAACVLLAPVDPVVRRVAAVTAVAAGVAFLVPSAVGGNLTRIVLIGAAPAVVATARLKPQWLLVAGLLTGALPVGLLVGGVVDASRPGSTEAFVTGLRVQLSRESQLAGHRLEVADVATHWPSARLLPTVTLARGWQRQTDEAINPELYDGPPLTAADYRAFLDRNAVAFVAVPRNAPLDFGTEREAALIATGVPYLTLAWHNPEWNLYAVHDPAPAISSPATSVRLTDTGATFIAPRAGDYAMKLTWSPYLTVDGAVVTERADGDVDVTVPQAGSYDVHAVWRLP